MIEDAELLRRYAADRSQEAFAELVRRRVNLVYSVALRQVGGDAHLAEDVTQRVFADLARKAASLSGHAVLSGWLYRSAQFAATDVVRTERRRRVREQEAHTMHETTANPGAPVDWEKLRPVLDEVMGDLDEEDRDAVALRFFEERSFAEVGSAFRISEDAARKRVTRALDQLHSLLARRGVTSTTAALGVALANQVSATAPAGLAQLVTSFALATGGAGAGAGAFLFTMTKLKTGLIALLVAGGATVLTLELKNRRALSAKAERPEIQNAGKSVAEKPGTKVEPKRDVPPAPPKPAAVVTALPAEPAAGTDPNAGMTPVEKLVNAGRATPGAAFQTLVWAALKGNDGELAASLGLSNEAGKKAAVWWATLPLENQARFTPLEKLPGLFLTEEVLRKAAGLEVLRVSDENEDRATLHVRMLSLNGRVTEDQFPMIRIEGDWKMLIPENMIDGMRRSFEQKKPKTAP